jgi:hypothetical protein
MPLKQKKELEREPNGLFDALKAKKIARKGTDNVSRYLFSDSTSEAYPE